MKRAFLKSAKNFGCRIETYNSYRSDMGCQVFELLVISPNGNSKLHVDSYYVGQPEGKAKVIDYFKETLLPDLIGGRS